MGSRPFSYWPIKVGLLLIVSALLMSVIGLHKSPVRYSESGVLGPGFHLLGNGSFEDSHFYSNRTLELYSRNASVVISWEGSREYSLNITADIRIHPSGRPRVKVISGNVSYTYEVLSYEYPYSDLALPALVTTILGTILVFVGYLKLKGGG